MCVTVTIAQQDIGKVTQFLECLFHHGDLAKAQEPGQIGEAYWQRSRGRFYGP